MKRELRIKFKKLREKELPKCNDLIIKEILKLLDSNLNIHNNFIGIYWPLSGEIDLRILKEKKPEISIALPSTNSKGNINYHPWKTKPLKKDFHGIPAPIDEPKLSPNQLSLLLVPAIAIDKNGYRLGYGGGFFDRLRKDASWRSINSLVVIQNVCVSVEPLPRDPWDIPFDGWINEKGLFKIQTKEDVV